MNKTLYNENPMVKIQAAAWRLFKDDKEERLRFCAEFEKMALRRVEELAAKTDSELLAAIVLERLE